jgi:hypothetical protein
MELPMSSSLVIQVHSLNERRQNAGTITTGPIQHPFSEANTVRHRVSA